MKAEDVNGLAKILQAMTVGTLEYYEPEEVDAKLLADAQMSHKVEGIAQSRNSYSKHHSRCNVK